MKALACVAVLITAVSSFADTESDLRELCAEQERQIIALEKKVEALHSELALERRRSRGTDSPAAAPPAPAQAGASYKVQAGDTLTSISRRYKTSPESLMKDNGIKDPTRLRVGQILEIASSTVPVPEAEKASAEKPAPAVAKQADSPLYRVRAGDTFYKIAREHSLTVAKLEGLNPGIDPARIIVGQQLAVAGTPRKAPGQSASGTRMISTPAPKKPAAQPAPGKETPEAAGRKEAPEPEPKPEPEPRTISTIIVMEEISFENFARKHGASTEQLNALNGLSLKNSTVLAKGSELYVPGR